MPREYSLNYCGDEIKAPSTDLNNEIWVVFSDRDKNPTYQRPGGKVKFKEATYLESFLVIKEKGDYLCLVKYDPEIVDQSFLQNKIKNKDKALYYGWVNKANLLLTKQSSTDIETGFKNKSISIITNQDALEKAKVFIKQDSIQVYTDEGLTKAGKKIPFYELLYVYKTSADNKKAFVARKPTLSLDSVDNEALGWVHSSLLRNIGQRLYIDLNSVPKDNLKFVSTIGHGVDPLYIDEANWTESFNFSKKEKAFQYAPVFNYKKKNDAVRFKTGIPMHVLDPESNYVLNVDGDRIYYNEFKKWEKDLRKLNIIFVFEGKKQVIKSYPKLINIIQNLQPAFDKAGDHFQYKFGAVTTFRGIGSDSLNSDIHKINLTSSYTSLLEELNLESQYIGRCAPISMNNTWLALSRAVDMIDIKHRDETNLLIVVGESGDGSEIIEQGLLKKIANANCRVLGFQLFNENSSLGNNFVLQISDLIRYYAEKESIKKRKKIVYAEQIVQHNYYREEQKNMYALDFPTNSMTQGWVLFPKKNTDLVLNNLGESVEKMLAEVKSDNDTIISSLDKLFGIVTKYKTKYNPLWIRYNTLGDDGIEIKKTEGNAKIESERPMWYLPSDQIVINDPAVDEKINYKLLLAQDELDDFITFVNELCENEVDYKYKAEKKRAKKPCNCPEDEIDAFATNEEQYMDENGKIQYVKTKRIRSEMFNVYMNRLSYCKLCGPSTKVMHDYTLAEAQEKILGCSSSSSLLLHYKIKDIKDKNIMSDSELDSLIEYFKLKRESLEDLMMKQELESFGSNGETYYWVDKQLLP